MFSLTGPKLGLVVHPTEPLIEQFDNILYPSLYAMASCIVPAPPFVQ